MTQDRRDDRVCPAGHGPAPTSASWRCEQCGAPYVLERWSFVDPLWPTSGDGVWRYRDWLPRVRSISLGEPTTPLVDLPSHHEGVRVKAKLEGALPTGSFKDRGSALLGGWLAGADVREAVIDSSGNAGSSLAAYCATLGIRCSVYAPESASPAKLVQVRAYGAAVVTVPGSRSDTTRAALDAAARAIYASHMWNPYFIAGTQTFAFELTEQLGAAPAAVVFPLGAGTLMLGAHLGFRGLLEAGLIERLPRLHGVQAAACAPLVAAFEGAPVDGTSPCGSSLAEGILIASPPRADAVLAAVRESEGSVLAVSEAEIADAFRKLARCGVYVEPTSAVAAAGLERVLDGADRPPDGVVVVALTGTGLKASASAERLAKDDV